METTGAVVSSTAEESPRVKFLCSFNGSILPRPQDGKLRYVGGETRIVSVPREISFEDLMMKMRELFDGVSVLKYQQPDEDLDALVSVVNDDDVTNMMEEYDKLGSSDGFTRLRIFLFMSPDHDGSVHFNDGDERDNERRYVDALNSLNESPDFRKGHIAESLLNSPVDDMHAADHYFSQMSIDGQRNFEMAIPQVNLRNLTIPHGRSNLHQQQSSSTQRYNEMEAPWSPAYYSPRQQHLGQHDVRQPNEISTSPTAARYGLPYAEFPERNLDRISDDYSRQQVNHHQSNYDHQPQVQLPENLLWLPTGTLPGEKAGFPGNILHGSGIYEGNSICEHCRPSFHRNHEEANFANGFHQVHSPCAECPPTREPFILNPETKLHHSFYPREQIQQNDPPRSLYPQHQLTHHISGAGNLAESQHMLPGHYLRPGTELGSEAYHEPTFTIGSPRTHSPLGNLPYNYGPDSLYQIPHGPPPLQGHSLLRTPHNNPIHAIPSYDGSSSHQQANGPTGSAFVRAALEGSPRFRVGIENQNPWIDPSVREHSQLTVMPKNSYNLDNQNPVTLDPTQPPREILISSPRGVMSQTDYSPAFLDENLASLTKSSHLGKIEMGSDQNANLDDVACLNDGGKSCNPAVKLEENAEFQVERMSFLPELIESVKKAALMNAEEIKDQVQEKANSVMHDQPKEAVNPNETEASDIHGDFEMDSDSETAKSSKIEPTKAEEEAVSRGLQTIRNDDLEEIRELGSGTYGAVFHGKWKGSDVAIKRIKASCFNGRPSERERLIADFWKEALILSSLHHPNVVSFYGIVRDGPDGSLATVTEFMINGSLKQFLQKKDRTIDRRKRLIIAMDAAFGMEYLHGKNIVHFDLKCENLLVNMRDPHRPVCKIGDLGLSKVKQHTLVSGGVRGTLPWMAPELLSGKSHMVTEKIDVYSFGIVMWELLTGDEPYSDMHCASIIGGIVNNSLRPQIPTWCDPEWKSLMGSCWAAEPSQRPSFSEISQKLRTMAAAINLK
jgi:hypothetical protein